MGRYGVEDSLSLARLRLCLGSGTAHPASDHLIGIHASAPARATTASCLRRPLRRDARSALGPSGADFRSQSLAAPSLRGCRYDPAKTARSQSLAPAVFAGRHPAAGLSHAAASMAAVPAAAIHSHLLRSFATRCAREHNRLSACGTTAQIPKASRQAGFAGGSALANVTSIRPRGERATPIQKPSFLSGVPWCSFKQRDLPI